MRRISYFAGWLTLLMLMLPTRISAQPIDFHFPNYNTTNGLITNVVHHSMQDSRGFMWFATDSGVSRYDGTRFQHYSTNDGLGGNEIFYIYEDSRGRIWFVSFNGIPSYYYNSTFYNPSNSAMLSELVFNNMHVAVFEDHENATWLYSLEGTIYRIAADSTVTRIPSDGLTNMLRQGWVDAENRVFAGTSVGTYIFNDSTQSWTYYSDMRFRVIQHQHTAQGSFLVPTIDGIFYSGSTEPYFIHKDALGIDSEVSFVTRGESQIYLAVGTIGNGVKFYHYDGANTHSRISTILENHVVTSITFDRQESLWITTLRNGVYRIDRAYSNLRNIVSPYFENDFSIRSSLTTRDGYVWYGTGSGNLLVYDNNGSPVRVNWMSEQQSLTSLEDLYELHDGRLAIVTSSGLLLAVRSNQSLRVTHSFETSGKRFVQRGNDLFIGSTTGLFIVLPEVNGFSEPLLRKRVTELSVCEQGYLWTGTINGLHVYDQQMREVQVHPIFENQQITAIEPLFDNIIAVATHGSGLVLYDITSNTILKHITTEFGLADDMIKALRFDTNQLWVSTGFGISLISLNPDSDIRFQVERLPQGLRSYSGRLFGTQISSIELRDNEIWLAGDNTLIAMDRSETGAAPSIIPLIIEQVTINDRNYRTGHPETVPFNDNQWTFSFTGILFRDSDRLLYRYRLNNENNPPEEWSQTRNNAVTYRRIPPGTYTFEVEAFTSDGNVFSRNVSVPFTINRPWWMLPWVIAGAIVLTLGLVIMAFNVRVRQVREKEKQKLEFQRQVNELEYQALQAMMNPHFVFNILNNIRYQILKDDKTQASRLLVDFSKLIRRQLDSAYQRSTSLSEEISRLQLYTELESVRLQYPIQFSYQIADDIDAITTHIPSMLLQPFIENAIIHGIAPKQSSGEISLTVERAENRQIRIIITDNGSGIKTSRRQTVEGERLSLGTELVRRRLEILAKDSNLDWSVSIENIVGEGVKATGVSASLLLPIR